MGEPLRVAARLLAELPPFLQFLRGVHDSDLPSQRGHGRGLEAPDPAFWRAAADEALRELRAEPPPQDAEACKARLRRLLQRAQSGRRVQQRLASGARHSELPLAARSAGSRTLPPGVVEVIGGLFFVNVEDANARVEGDPACTSMADLGSQAGVDETVVVGCGAADSDEDLWNVYRLFADRLVLIFDQGKTVLVVGPSRVLNCLLYGILLRCWQLSTDDAAKHIRKVGRDPADISEAFRNRISESPGVHGLPCNPGEQPPPTALALRAHVRLLDESRPWPLQRAEPLVRATEALLARALGWEPHSHDAASPGIVCLTTVRTVRLELERVANKRYATALRELVSIGWRIGSRTTLEDGLVLEPDAAAGPDEPALLAEELAQELQHAVHLPKLLLVVVEGSRPVILSETFSVSPQVSYHTYAVVVGSRVMTRGPSKAPPAVQGASATGDGKLLLPQQPVTVVLVQERLTPWGTWVPWSDVLQACPRSCEVPRPLGERTFQLRLVTLAQHESARRSGRRSAWEEVDIVGVSELPIDAKASLLQRRLSAQLQIPVAWQLLLAPGEHGWRYLLPNARIIDHAVSPPGGSGPLVLVLSVIKETSAMLPRSSKAAAEQDASTFLSFPWMPVICLGWADRQMISLDVVLFDARRPLSSYAARIARRLEEEVGSHAYCTAFAAYELQAPKGEAAAGASAWRPLKMGAPVATEIQMTALSDNSGTLPAPCLVWEAMPLAPSMTGRGLFAAHDTACLPDLSAAKKQMPLERLTARKTEELGAVLLQGPRAEPPKSLHNGAASEAEEYAALLVLEERLLVAWIDDSAEGVCAVTAEARRRMDCMIARLRAMAPDEAPPGLKEWPIEPVAQWSGRTWERVCRGAAQAQAWATPAPDASEAEVARGLLWAEVCTLQEIVLSLDSIRIVRQGHAVLDGVRRAPRVGRPGIMQAAHLGPRLSDVADAERKHYMVLLQSSELNELFSEEVEDLPSECDSDIAGLHALVQTTNAELNAMWSTNRSAVLAGESEQLWRAVRLRELALSAPFLLVKQTQSTKVLDELSLEWLQQVQLGCRLVLQKSQILCEAASAMVGPAEGGEEAIAKALEDLVGQLESARRSLDELLLASGGGEGGPTAEEAERVLNACDMHTLSGNLFALALERQLEACALPASRGTAKAMRDVREGLHRLTPKAMLVRASFDLPLVEDTVATFATESQRRGRKLRLVGRNPRRPAAAPGASRPGGNDEEADQPGQEAAEAAAEAQARALLRSEDQARAKKDVKKRRQRAKKPGQTPGTPEAAKAKGITDENSDNLVKDNSKSISANGEKLNVVKGVEAKAFDRILGPEGRALGRPLEPEEEAAPDGDVKAEEGQEVQEQLLLEKGPFELLGERRKARLLEIAGLSGARCTLEGFSQAVRLAGTPTAVAKARKLVEDLSVEWVQVADPVWAVLLRGRNSSGGHLSRLQAESQCSVVVDRSSPRIRVAGTIKQVEVAQAWLWRLHEDCDCAQVWLGPHVKAPDKLADEAEAKSRGVKVDLKRQRGGGCMARVLGLSQEVERAVEILQAAAAALQTPTSHNGSRPAANDEVADKPSPSSQNGNNRNGYTETQPVVRELRFGDFESCDWTPSDRGSTSPHAQVGEASPPVVSRRTVSTNGSCCPEASPRGRSGAPLPAARAPSTTPSRTPSPGCRARPELPTPTPATRERSPRERRGRSEDAKEDGAMSLAECLARQFPSARIIVGAPDEQLAAESQNPPGSAGRLEMQMKRLKDLLEQDKARPRHF